ncbi:MAG: hypothetical protein K2I22_05015 [Lachnospiraceae bacterium]|nr:hypothetical protein [Lachnospiraceae bacterium]
MRKMAMAAAAVVIIAALSSCGQAKSPEDDKSDMMGSITGIGDDTGEVQEIQNDDSAGSDDANPAENPEEAGQTVTEIKGDETENADSEMTAEELLDLFINGSISAVDSTDLTSTFYITDFNMDAYSVGENVDLDNDGENELIICGPYGGVYLDARDNKVYEFAVGEGTALVLSYTYYNGAIWIMYSNRSSAGFEFYHMEKFEGADNLVAEMNFGEELADPNNAEAGMKYTLNGAEISYDEYTELCSKIFAAQVDTN